ncbi:L-gulonolactone oxidase, partial [Paramuricea clavata]
MLRCHQKKTKSKITMWMTDFTCEDAICPRNRGLNMSSNFEGIKGYKFTNWSKTFRCEPELYFEPTNHDEIRKILHEAAKQNKKVKVIGEGHSPSDIQCTPDYMICLRKLNKVLNVNKETQQIKAQAGISLHELHQEALKHGLAVSLMPSVSGVSLGGLIATGTHSSGVGYGILATY